MTAGSKAEKSNWRVRVMNLMWSILVTAICFVLLVWLAMKLFEYAYSQWQATAEIAVGTFTTAGLDTDIGTSTGKALSSRLERLKRYSRSDASLGFVKTPALISVPNLVKERQTQARQRLEQLNLKVRDLSVNELIKSLTALFEPTRPVLAGTVTDYGDSLEINAELTWKDEALCTWVASRLKSDEAKADKDKIGLVLNGLYDDLLSQVLFDMPEANGTWCAEKPPVERELRNWQTLQAMTLGLESLNSYQSTLEHADLTRALMYLKRIPVYAPDYALGHYFYGVALSEDRQEQLAASMFVRTQMLEEAASARGNGHPKELQWNARLQRAASMVEEYDAGAAIDAVEILGTLSSDLQTAASSGDGNATFAQRLLPFVQARLAYSYGTLFRLQATATERLKDQAERAWNDAKASYNAVPEWPSDQQREDVWSWVLNAEGYARFRVAQWEYESGGAKGDQNRFMAASKEARTRIEEAIRYRPTNYLFLHSLGIILDDERLDPKNVLLDEAEGIYRRTQELVPQDYYQYERLARIYWRRAKAAARPIPGQEFHPERSALWRTFAEKGLEHVKAAEIRRMQSPPTATTVVCSAYFLVASALIETDPTKKTEAVRAAIDKADQAFTLGALTSPQRAPIGKGAADLIEALAKTIPDPQQPTQPTEKEKEAQDMKKRLRELAGRFASVV